MLTKLKRVLHEFFYGRADNDTVAREPAFQIELSQQLADCRELLAEQQKMMEHLASAMHARGQACGLCGTTAKAALTDDRQHEFDDFYLAFEDRFRGSMGDVKKRLEVYLPIIGRVKDLSCSGQILDLGCGRGEWLELLRDHGCTGIGVDANRAALTRCRGLGLEVVEADVLEYICQQETASCRMVTGFHLVEHLPFEVLMNVMHEIFRILQPGGVVIFETPDPENVVVGACNFHYDPTHRVPVPDITLQFMVEFTGFQHVEILKLHPHPRADLMSTGSWMQDEMQRRFFMSQDYAVIGFKPFAD